MLLEMAQRPAENDPEASQIPSSLYRQLLSTDAIPATLYGLSKIHKANIPLRPITSCVGSPTVQAFSP